jgi:hypothetical protein
VIVSALSPPLPLSYNSIKYSFKIKYKEQKKGLISGPPILHGRMIPFGPAWELEEALTRPTGLALPQGREKEAEVRPQSLDAETQGRVHGGQKGLRVGAGHRKLPRPPVPRAQTDQALDQKHSTSGKQRPWGQKRSKGKSANPVHDPYGEGVAAAREAAQPAPPHSARPPGASLRPRGSGASRPASRLRLPSAVTASERLRTPIPISDPPDPASGGSRGAMAAKAA